MTTLRRLLSNVKDKDKPEDRQGAVYKVKCCDCQATYMVRPAETLAHDWPNTSKRWEMVTSTITLLKTIYRRNIKSTGTLWHVLRILQTTRLTLHSWFTNLEQMPLSCYQQLTEYKRLIDKIKEKLTMREWLENWKWLTKDDCLTVTKDRSKHTNYITSLRSPKHQGLTDRRQITSSRNWPIRSITRV